MSVIIVVAALVLRWYLGFLNTKKKEMQSSLEAAEQRQKSMEELGDKHPGMSARNIMNHFGNRLIDLYSKTSSIHCRIQRWSGSEEGSLG